ncbi:MOSC domain-containing protein [Natronomonas gomsonensis]|jgi:MOSC domain-containing protein YiiM|uniref:MOSC domain-containing protein n=1 Tax=Natronomonas gomsonensis TaxID=1046043 RepID=UPI0020CA4107|nr:MOSC domain-containing protein [Natronomonas gomsonensis]MCY4729224.1 MOSC domain-containing protein [Natronomonas gomsonensis]
MRLEDIYVTEAGGEPMQSRQRIDAVAGGLDNDRYCTGRGHYSPFDVCEVTFVQAEALEEIERTTGIDLSDGQHRRNLVVRGGDVHDLLNSRFRLGEATFEGTRPRPPCRYIEQLNDEDGLMRALGEGRGGICARVDEPGEIAVGDKIEGIEEMGNFEGMVASIRDRVGR